jgi:intracellular sulfur oxidation DsrE/DsrF family protein
MEQAVPVEVVALPPAVSSLRSGDYHQADKFEALKTAMVKSASRHDVTNVLGYGLQGA